MDQPPKQKTVSLSITNSNGNRLRKSYNTEILQTEVDTIIKQVSKGRFNVLSLSIYNSSTLNLTTVPFRDISKQEFINMLITKFEKYAKEANKDIRLLNKVNKSYPKPVMDDVYQLIVIDIQTIVYMIPLDYVKQNKKLFDILDIYTTINESTEQPKFPWICSIIQEETGIDLIKEIQKYTLNSEKYYKICKTLFVRIA